MKKHFKIIDWIQLHILSCLVFCWLWRYQLRRWERWEPPPVGSTTVLANESTTFWAVVLGIFHIFDAEWDQAASTETSNETNNDTGQPDSFAIFGLYICVNRMLASWTDDSDRGVNTIVDILYGDVHITDAHGSTQVEHTFSDSWELKD